MKYYWEMRRVHSFVVFWLALCGTATAASPVLDWITDDFDVLMNTNGQITFAPYVNGGSPRNDFKPGYRSEFFTYVDFFSWKGLVSNWLIANSTIIERSDTSAFRLHRIRYTLTPGYRYEFDTWLISGLLLHECIHAIGEFEDEGSIWWNSFRFGFGSKGAYPQYLVERYRTLKRPHYPLARVLNKWDYQVNVGAFLYGPNSIWIAQNSDYRYSQDALFRYHLGRWGRWGAYADLNQYLWLREHGQLEQKWSATANLLLVGRSNIAGLYYTYVFFDDNVIDNEDALGSLGFKIVF
ncbi:MAG: hypothetical protein K0Q91_1135 [Fibrobacteria bacterium]|jgi:hypothetical protein|nr:hypothetical protein [Fibrobacteria bacterium]